MARLASQYMVHGLCHVGFTLEPLLLASASTDASFPPAFSSPDALRHHSSGLEVLLRHSQFCLWYFCMPQCCLLMAGHHLNSWLTFLSVMVLFFRIISLFCLVCQKCWSENKLLHPKSTSASLKRNKTNKAHRFVLEG